MRDNTANVKGGRWVSEKLAQRIVVGVHECVKQVGWAGLSTYICTEWRDGEDNSIERTTPIVRTSRFKSQLDYEDKFTSRLCIYIAGYWHKRLVDEAHKRQRFSQAVHLYISTCILPRV